MRKLLTVAICVSVVVILLLGPLLYFSFSNNFYLIHMQKNNVYDRLGEERTKNLTSNIIDFLKGETALSAEFDNNERSHMEDVRKLYVVATIIFTVAAILFFALIAAAYLAKVPIKIMLKTLLYGFVAALSVNILLILLALTNFGDFFISFHHIFFPQGNWQFPNDSLLITIFSSEFFSSIATYILLTSFILSLLLAGTTYFFFLRKTKHKKRK